MARKYDIRVEVPAVEFPTLLVFSLLSAAAQEFFDECVETPAESRGGTAKQPLVFVGSRYAGDVAWRHRRAGCAAPPDSGDGPRVRARAANPSGARRAAPDRA